MFKHGQAATFTANTSTVRRHNRDLIRAPMQIRRLGRNFRRQLKAQCAWLSSISLEAPNRHISE